MTASSTSTRRTSVSSRVVVSRPPSWSHGLFRTGDCPVSWPRREQPDDRTVVTVVAIQTGRAGSRHRLHPSRIPMKGLTRERGLPVQTKRTTVKRRGKRSQYQQQRQQIKAPAGRQQPSGREGKWQSPEMLTQAIAPVGHRSGASRPVRSRSRTQMIHERHRRGHQLDGFAVTVDNVLRRLGSATAIGGLRSFGNIIRSPRSTTWFC